MSADRQRRYRKRQRDGLAAYTVIVDHAVLDALVRLRLMADGQAGDRKLVERALSRLVGAVALDQPIKSRDA